ncbi:hypothetical protein SH668x_002911 [Planctomicrobium sp. SH668]|uniref:hypothetical protein n=1 Tax=Planctomicrobium sp. SH668 TaxID=3448126 RepID=UPI003F5BCC97
MASSRAPAVAEILWELKRSDKVAKYGVIAQRAGFSAGANGRAMQTCLTTILREWPHLQAWRAIRDDNTVETKSDQARELAEWGASLAPGSEAGRSNVTIDAERLMVWPQASATSAAASAVEVDDEEIEEELVDSDEEEDDEEESQDADEDDSDED